MKVFISYRRDKGSDVAHLIKNKLNMNGIKTFLDTENIGIGKFKDTIVEEIKTSSMVVVILTEGSLERFLKDDKGDNSLFEINVAFNNGINILPINKAGESTYKTLISKASELPKSISQFKDLNIIEYIDGQVDFIVNKILKELYLSTKDNYNSSYLSSISNLSNINNFPYLVNFINKERSNKNIVITIMGEKYRYFGNTFFDRPIGEGFLSKEDLTVEYEMYFDIRYSITGFGKIINNKRVVYEGYIVEGKPNGFGVKYSDSIESGSIGFYVDGNLIVILKSDTTSKLYSALESLNITIPFETSEGYHKFKKIVTTNKFSGVLEGELDTSNLVDNFLSFNRRSHIVEELKEVKLEVLNGNLKSFSLINTEGKIIKKLKNKNSSSLIIELVKYYSNYWETIYKKSDNIKFDTVVKSKLKDLNHPIIDVSIVKEEFKEMQEDEIWVFVGLFSNEKVTKNSYTSYGVVHLYNETKKSVFCIGILGSYDDILIKGIEFNHLSELYDYMYKVEPNSEYNFYIDFFNLEVPIPNSKVPIESSYKYKPFYTNRVDFKSIFNDI